MLLHTLLALVPLLDGATAPSVVTGPQLESPSLAWSIPDDALIAARWNDPKGMLENGMDNAWLSFVYDPRWLQLEAFQDIDLEAVDMAMMAEYGLPILKECSEVIAWLDGIEQPEPNVYLAIRASEEAQQKIVDMVLSESEEVTEGDYQFAVDETSALVTKQGVVLLFLGTDPMGRLPELASIMDSMLSLSEPAGVFESTPLDSDRNPDNFEFLVQFAAFIDMVVDEDDELAAMPEAALAELEGFQWVYMSCSFGEGEELDFSVVMPFMENGYIDQFLGFAGSADMANFSRVPADAIGAAVGNFDLSGAIDWMIEQFIDEGLTTQEEVETGILEMEETIGVHIFDDLLDHLTGDYLQVLFPTETYDKEMQNMVALSYGLIIMGVSDTEEVEATLTSLMEVAAMAVSVEEEDASWGTVWGVDVMGMFDIQIGTNSDSMFLSAHPDAIDLFEAHRDAGADAPSFKTLPGAEAIIEELEGCYAYLYRTSMLFEMIPTFFENMPEFEEDPDLAIFIELFDVAAEVAEDNFSGLIGTSVSFDGRIRATTIAR